MAGVGMEEIRGAMKKRDNIRNVAVIGGENSGLLTLMDSLENKSGLSLTAEERKRSKRYVVDPSTTNITCLHHTCTQADLQHMDQYTTDDPNFVINILNTPGSVDFSAEVDTALRVVDGVVIIVDCLSGVTVDIKNIIRQAVRERVKPVLFINNIEKAITEHRLTQEELYQTLYKIVEAAKGILATYIDEHGPMGSIQFDPTKGNILFGSAQQGWGVTLREVASAHAEKLAMAPETLVNRLWGDNFYNSTQKKWKNEPGSNYIRTFNCFLLDPIYKIFAACGNTQSHSLPDLIESIGVQLTIDTSESNGQQKLKAAMSQWLPIANSILTMIILQLPSPLKAQGYRSEVLATCNTDDRISLAIKNCDPQGPLVLYVTKWLQVKDSFYAIGRVFSGTIVSGSEINEPDRQTAITDTAIITCDKIFSVQEVQCGNLCLVLGIDQRIARTGVVSDHSQTVTFSEVRHSVIPIVKLDVEPKNPAEVPTLLMELKKLMKLHPVIECLIGDSGLHTIVGPSEHLILRCKEYLEKRLAIKSCKPFVAYRETVTKEPPMLCTGVSPNNKKNEISVKTIPLPNGCCECIEEGFISAHQNPVKRADYLAQNFGYDLSEADMMWCFGPDGNGPNMFFDNTKHNRDLSNVKDGITSGFRWATREGVICSENMRGVKVDLRFARWKLEEDSDVAIATRRAIHGSVLASVPRLMEPLSLVEISCSQQQVSHINEILKRRQGKMFEERRVGHTTIVKCYVPGESCLGIKEELSGKTYGVQVAFDHWEIMESDPLDPDSLAGQVAMTIRERKGLRLDIPGSHASSA